MSITNDQNSSKVFDQIAALLNTWRKMANALQTGLVSFGFVSILGSLFITSFVDSVNPLAIKIVGLITTLSLTIIGSYNLPSKAARVRNGWRHLNRAVLSYQAGSIDINSLIKAYEEGEVMLGSVEFNYEKPTLSSE